MATVKKNVRGEETVKIDTWLAELKIPREAYRLVTLLPLVHVAWADGKVQREERKLILEIAAERGLLENGGRETLEHWLSVPPDTAQVRTDLAMLNELARSRGDIADEFDADSLHMLLAWCQDVADAAGGLLGLVPARRDAEHAALKSIATALDIRNAKGWNALGA
jgi:hypothetical protein